MTQEQRSSGKDKFHYVVRIAAAACILCLFFAA